MPWLVGALWALAAAGFAWFVLQALRSGAEGYSSAYTAAAARHLDDMFVFIPARRILELAMASGALCGLTVFLAAGGLSRAGFARGALLGAAAGALGWQIPERVLRVLKRRRLRRFNEQLVGSLVTMSNALKAGFSIQQAFEAVVKEGQNPIAQEFGVMLHQMRVGAGMDDALQGLEARVGSEDLSLMVVAVQIARQTGGSLTEVFERIAHTIRERMRIEGRIRTLTAQGRLQGIVVGVMPILLGLAMLVLDPRLVLTFVHSAAGLVVLGAVALLEVAGFLVIRRIIRIDV
jgi:tight adherence protein B